MAGALLPPQKKSWERTEDSETLPGPDSGSGWHSGAADGGRLEGAVDGGINFPADGGLEWAVDGGGRYFGAVDVLARGRTLTRHQRFLESPRDDGSWHHARSARRWWRLRIPSPRQARRTPANSPLRGDLVVQGRWYEQRLPCKCRCG